LIRAHGHARDSMIIVLITPYANTRLIVVTRQVLFKRPAGITLL